MLWFFNFLSVIKTKHRDCHMSSPWSAFIDGVAIQTSPSITTGSIRPKPWHSWLIEQLSLISILFYLIYILYWILILIIIILFWKILVSNNNDHFFSMSSLFIIWPKSKPAIHRYHVMSLSSIEELALESIKTVKTQNILTSLTWLSASSTTFRDWEVQPSTWRSIWPTLW